MPLIRDLDELFFYPTFYYPVAFRIKNLKFTHVNVVMSTYITLNNVVLIDIPLNKCPLRYYILPNKDKPIKTIIKRILGRACDKKIHVVPSIF